MEKQNSKKELSYYITLFKIEGHTTWRAHMSGHKNGFAEQMLHDKAKVTATRCLHVDRITGTLTEVK